MKVNTIERTVWTNLTEHVIRIYNSDGELAAEIPPSGMVARIFVKREAAGTINGVEIFRPMKVIPFVVLKSDGETKAPSEVQGNLIVSVAIREAMAGTEISSRLFSPGVLKRDNKGQPIGCIGLDES